MELLIYKASAGSGKTFTLAVEYIKHLILNPRAYRQILAVTFTNKATGEMKERILQQLNGIRLGDVRSDDYLNRIQSDLQQRPDGERWSKEAIRQRADMALHFILHDYTRFRVETIDSCFQSVMCNLARELELSPNLNIELNQQEVLNQAVDSLIEKLSPDLPVLTWLLEYIEERIHEDKRWNVTGELKKFAQNIFNENYIERGEQLRQKLKQPETIRLYKETLRTMETDALETMKGFSQQFEDELEMNGLSEEDLSNKGKGISSYFRKLGKGILSNKELMNITLQKHLEDKACWVSKSHPNRKHVLHLVETSLYPLLCEAEKFRLQKVRTVNSCRLSMKHLYKLQLLNHIDEEVRTQNYEHNRFLLSDTNALLHKLIGDGDSSFIYEKLGANLHNVMIDEFQDTSRMQWENFRLLLLEGLSQGSDSLIVGDVKQSIYRWRNGDWSILNNLGKSHIPFPFPIRTETLTTNRRSETNIILFNNHLFTKLVEQLNQKYLSEQKEECSELKNAYADVVQESPKKQAEGYVKLTFVEKEEESNYEETQLKKLGKEVQTLLQHGIRQNDITILVRKKKQISLIANYLNKELQIPVISNEAFRLDASPAINLLINALQYLNNEKDGIALEALRMDYGELPDEFMQRHNELRLLPLYELTEELVSLFRLNEIEKQEAYLLTFFDAVTEYLQTNASDIGNFLKHWDEVLCAKTIAGGETEGIRAYSIHKSKGLQFHTVLLPFCDWKMENETNDHLVWCCAPEKPYNHLDLIPVNYSAVMEESVYQKAYREERLQLWVDNLNILYVALTRPKKNLLIWSNQEQRGTIGELLQEVLPSVARSLGKEWASEAFEFGTLSPSEEKKTAEGTTTTPLNRFACQPEELPLCMTSNRPAIEFRQSNRSADFIAGINETESWQRFINRGNLLHTLFSQIETEADIDNAISHLLFEGIINSEQQEEISRMTRTAFQDPQVKEWYNGTWQLFNECDIIWMEKGELHKRRPDRVMMRNNDIVVIDFKFGKPDKRYNRQVQGYMNLLKKMGYETANISGYLWYVESGNIEQV